MRQPKNTTSHNPKHKVLSIHIATDHIGPHGMPLVYGSTPEKTGTIKGTVKFECNYDCKGRDITILYEAKAEAHWTAIENKKIVNHRTEEIFGHAIWHFPLEHTRPNGSTIATGVYEKEFEVPLIHPSVSSALNRSSVLNVSAKVDASPPVKAATGLRTKGSTALLPSSSYGPNTKIKYTIHAILRRPFPSITNVEASQEVWVLHSSMPPPPPQLLLPPKSAPATTTASKLKPSRGGRTEPPTLPSNPAPAVTAPSPTSPADSAALTSGSNSASPSHAPSSAGEASDPQKLSSPRSLLSLSLPTKAIRSALSMLPLPTIDLRSKPLNLSSAIEKDSNAEVERLVEPQSGVASADVPATKKSDASAVSLSPSTSSPSTASSSSQSAITGTDGYASDDTLPSSDDESDSGDENSADYTGVWEPFQMPYSCSLPSETVYLGQAVPLTIRFGPRKEYGAVRYKDKSRSRSGRKGRKKDRDDGRHHQRNGHSKRRSEKDHVVPQPRFVIKKGIVKVVEHTLLREVTVTPAPPALINHHNYTASIASAPTKNAHTLPSGSEATYDHRAGLLSFKQGQQEPQKELSGHVHASTIGGGEPVILPSFATNSLKSPIYPIYQGQGYNGSNCHLYELMDKDAKQVQQEQHRRSGEHIRSFFKSKRHSLDNASNNHRSTTSESSPIGLHLSPAALTANDSSLSPLHRLPPPPPTATPSSSNSKIVSSIEAKFKTEAMTISLTSLLQQRERQYQKLLAGKCKDSRGGLAGTEADTNEGADEGEEEVDGGDEDDVEAERDLEEGVWQTTVYIQLPGLSDLATFTETKHIVKTHSLQLILLCGLVLDTSHGAGGGANTNTAAIAGCGTGAPMAMITKPGINKEFRLEMDLHVTGPRAPSSPVTSGRLEDML